MKRESRPHGEKEFHFRPHHIDNPEHYRDNYDRIFKKGKYAEPQLIADEDIRQPDPNYQETREKVFGPLPGPFKSSDQ